jgi:hypothetical protein
MPNLCLIETYVLQIISVDYDVVVAPRGTEHYDAIRSHIADRVTGDQRILNALDYNARLSIYS